MSVHAPYPSVRLPPCLPPFPSTCCPTRLHALPDGLSFRVPALQSTQSASLPTCQPPNQSARPPAKAKRQVQIEADDFIIVGGSFDSHRYKHASLHPGVELYGLLSYRQIQHVILSICLDLCLDMCLSMCLSIFFQPPPDQRPGQAPSTHICTYAQTYVCLHA